MPAYPTWIRRLILAACLSALGGISAAANASERIALLADLSSYAAEYGQQQLAGLQLLAEEKRPDGRHLALTVQDSKGLPREGVGGLSQMLSQGPKPILLVSALSSVSTVILPLADRNGLLTLCNAASQAVLNVSGNSIRNFVSPEQEFASFYDGAIKPLHVDRLGLIHANDEYGQAMAALFRQRWSAALANGDAMEESYGFETRDVRPIATRVVSRRLQGVIIVGYGPQVGLLVRQLRETGFDGHIFVPSLLVNTDAVAKAAGTALRGVIFNGFDYQSDAATQSVLTRFRHLYSGRQSDIGILTYVAARIIIETAPVGASPSQVIAALEAAQPFDTVLGQVRFANRSFVYPLKVYQVGGEGIAPFSP